MSEPKVPRPRGTNSVVRTATQNLENTGPEPLVLPARGSPVFESSTMIYARPTLSRYDYRIAAEQSRVLGGVRA